MKVVSKYKGEVKLPDGRKMSFTVEGTSQSEVKGLIRQAQPKARIKIKKKGSAGVPKRDGSGGGKRLNKGRGGCVNPSKVGKGRK